MNRLQLIPLFCGACGEELPRALAYIGEPRCTNRRIGTFCGVLFHPIKKTDVFAIPTGEVIT